MTLAELLASKKQGTERFPGFSLADLLARRNEPLDAKFNPSGVGPGVSYGSLASILADFAPGIGDVKSAADAIKEAEAGNYGMSLADAFGALPLIGGMGAIKAYHGSPHTFDAFDMSKIGTGEGAQAYGHGLYFAESPEVAKQYAGAVGDKTNVYKIDGEYVDPDSLPRFQQLALRSLVGPSKVSKKEALRRFKSAGTDQANIDEFVKFYDAHKKRASFSAMTDDNLYETSLEWPDPAREAADPLGPQHFLDWDRPLSDQGGSVKEALKNVRLPEMWTLDDFLDNSATGRDLHERITVESRWNELGKPSDQPAARSALLEAGIPGIRYLDQGSRGNGVGTYNYVVFDDKIPRIISRNGVTLADLLKR